MLEIVHNTRIPFMKYRKYGYAFSLLIIGFGLVSLLMHGGKFRLGVDFAGGRIIEYRFSQPVTADHLRKATDQLGLRDAEIQESGTGGLSRYQTTTTSVRWWAPLRVPSS